MGHPMQMWPVLPAEKEIAIDLGQWEEGLGGGGFAEALSSSGDPDHVLKRMHEEVPIGNAIAKMRQLSAHAKVMGVRLEDILAASPPAFVAHACRSLRNTLTTHIGYSEQNKHVYLYQRRAAGLPLRQLLTGDPPDWRSRVEVAKNFAAAMVALGRCRVVHLDCSPDNVFVQPQNRFGVTLIDLDGCGVLAKNEDGTRQDTWDIAPMTLGRPDETRPVWFPCNAEWQAPLAGYFKFAERWCVINEVWRILSWGGTAMSWLDDTLNDLFLGYEKASDLFRERTAHLTQHGATLDANNKNALLASCQREVAGELQGLCRMALKTGIDPQGIALGPIPIPDQEFLVEFARLTLLAFLDPRNPLLTNGDPALRGEIPNAKWVQDRLIGLRRSRK